MYNRRFLAANINENMFSPDVRTGGFSIEPTKSSLSELKGIDKIYCSINNKALVNTLERIGIKTERLSKFIAEEGDTIFTVQVKGIDGPIRKFSEDEELPETSTLIVTRYDFVRKSS